MRISDRTLGYISLVTLIGLFAFIAYCMWEAHHEARKIIEVDFNELGSLQPEDQVVIRGYTVGTIGRVLWLGDRARVQIKFNEPIIIREGTQFNNVNYAIMGHRRLEIIPSKTGKILPDDHIFQGHFEPGIAEALRQIENVNEQIAAIRELVHLAVEGDSLHEPVSAIFEQIIFGVEQTPGIDMVSGKPSKARVISSPPDWAAPNLLRAEEELSTISLPWKALLSPHSSTPPKPLPEYPKRTVPVPVKGPLT